MVNQWVFDHCREMVELAENYIGKLERGVIRWPNQRYRQALRAILRAETDAQLGFYLQRRRSTGASVSDVDRQQFFRLAGTVMTLPWLDLFTPAAPTPVPAKVGRIEIDQVRNAAKVFCSWSNRYGGGLARETVVAQLRWSAQLLHADCPDSLRSELFAAVAKLCSVAGFMAFDADVHDDARRAFRFGVACAEQSGNAHVRSWLLGDTATQDMRCGRLDEALTHAELALVRPEKLTAVERARLHVVRAQALAKLDRAQDTLSAIGAADEALTGGDDADRSWEGPYDHAYHRGLTGLALFDLALAGRKTQAGAHLAYAVTRFAPGAVRARAIVQTKHASLLMVTGDPRHAAVVGHRALDAVVNLNSPRAADDLRELRRLANRHSAIPAARELSDRITERLGS